MTKPMLCKVYKDFSPSFLQPKLDGIRCIAHLVFSPSSGPYIRLESRNEKPLNLHHLTRPLLALFSRLNNTLFFDGELYIHGKSFQDIASMVKRGNHPHQDLISYHIYDRQLIHPWKDQRFDIRFYGVDFPKLENIVKVPTFYCPTENDANKMHAKFVAQGYEGTIYRVGRCLYEEDKRSPNLLKRKDWQEEDFDIIDIEEGKGKNAGTAIFVCAANEERFFRVTAHGTYANKAKIYDQAAKYIGKKLSVEFQNYTDDGIPRFPIALGFKEDR